MRYRRHIFVKAWAEALFHTNDNASTSTTRFVRGIFFSIAWSIIARKTPFMRSRLADFSRK